MAAMLLLGIAFIAGSAALGWTRTPLPLATWALWTIAAVCGLLSLFLLIGLDAPAAGDLTPDDLAARGDFTDPGRMAGPVSQGSPATARAPRQGGESPRPWRRYLAIALVAAFLWGTGILRDLYRTAVDIVTAKRESPPPPAPDAPKKARPIAGATTASRPPDSAPGRTIATIDCSEASLHQASVKQCLARLEQLLAGRPGDIELRDPRGLTPLAAAVLADRLESAELLLKARADVNAPVRFAPGTAPRVGGLAKAQTPELAEFSTPLIMAKSAPMATLLLLHRADPRLKNDYGWSAIFYFTRNGTPDMIDILIAGGANIDDTADVDPSHAGSTPLMWAAFMNLLPQLDALLNHRPRLDIRDRAGNTALDYATRLKRPEAVARLKAAAAAP